MALEIARNLEIRRELLGDWGSKTWAPTVLELNTMSVEGSRYAPLVVPGILDAKSDIMVSWGEHGSRHRGILQFFLEYTQ